MNIFLYRTRKEEIRAFSSQVNTTSVNFVLINQTDSIESVPIIWETETYAYTYGAIIFIFFLTALARSIITFIFCASASQNLHDNMFKGLISTTMRFFDINQSGRIMNRFSKDMGSTDEALPRAILDAIQNNLIAIGAILVTIFVNPKFGVVIFIMFILFILIRKIYLKSSLNIKRFEAISKFENQHSKFSSRNFYYFPFSAKSPVFTHISSTLCGLPTIRAAKAEEILEHEFDCHQDLNTATFHMSLGR